MFQRAELAGEGEKGGGKKKGEWEERKIDALSIPKGWLNRFLQKALDIDNTVGRWERMAVRVCFPSTLMCKLCMLLNTFVNACASTVFWRNPFKTEFQLSQRKRVWVGGTFLSIHKDYRLHQKTCTYMLEPFQIWACAIAFLYVPQY